MTRFDASPLRRDRAAATVVGAILVVSLVVVGLITFRTSFVPVWEEEAEQRFMDEVAESLLRVRGDLNHHLISQEGQRLSTPIATSQGGETPSAPPREGNILSFREQPRTTTVHADDATVWRRNGTLQVRENVDWTDVPGTDLTVSGVDEVLDLRVRFASVSSGSDGDAFVIRVIGGEGSLQGLIRYHVEDTREGPGGPEKSEIIAEVENADGLVVFDQTIATFTQAQTDYELDVLDPWIGFDQILASAPAPKRLVLIENGLDADRALTFRARNLTSDTTVVDPGGGPVETVHETFPGGFLRYESRNNFYVDQTYRLEAGALVLEQEDGSTLRTGPHAPAGRVENLLNQDRVAFGLGLPTLEGGDQTVAGAGAVTATTESLSKKGIQAVAPRASFNVSTETPDAWSTWLDDHYRDAGLDPAEFAVDTGSDFVNVTVIGPSTDPAVDDVHLDIHQARISTTLER